MNWNIRLAYIQTITGAIGFGIIQTAFSVYVYLLSGEVGILTPNLILGNLFTTSGLASTIFVFPSGYFADKYRRDFLIRISVFFGILGQIILIYSTTKVPSSALVLLFVAQLFGGLSWGLSGPASQALIADSIEPGNRSKVFANMHFINLVAAAAGPFLAAALTIFLGDNWEFSVLQVIIFFGAFANIIGNAAVIFASDDKALVSVQERGKEKVLSQDDQIEDIGVKKSFQVFNKSFDISRPSYDWVVPITIVISGIIIGFGAGATVAFFPILFASETIGYGLKPLFTYSVVGITNIATGIMGLVAQRMIKFFGRIISMFLVQGLAIICLLGLVVNIFLFQNQIITWELSVVILVGFYLTRNALMNASGPISRSIVMDVVPASSRAKWNSLETLAWGMFWSVSASIGGFIVDTFGFIYVFLFTATLYTIATSILLTIRNRVPKESVLSQSYQLGTLKTRNRVVLPSLSNQRKFNIAEDVSGQLTREASHHYISTADGGTALIYFEPAYISRSGKSHAYQLGIHDDYTIPRLEETVTQIHQLNSLAGLRLNHAGAAAIISLTGETPLAPSAIPNDKNQIPVELTQSQIIDLQSEFVQAGKRADHAGFDIIELAACLIPYKESNLIGQFLSSEFNKREDQYGGSLVNRSRFIIEILKSLKQHLSPKTILSFHLTLPIPGLVNEEILEFIGMLRDAGIDLLCIGYSKNIEALDISSVVNEIKSVHPMIPLILQGDFDIKRAETILKKGQVDMIGFEKLILEDQTFPQALR
ncbi:MFS transporter [Candidatus Hodarchaeum mangrovi]